MKDAPKRSKKTTIFRYAYIGLTIVAIVLIGLLDNSFASMVEALRTIDLAWLAMALAMLLGYWFTDAVLLSDVTSYMHQGGFSFMSSLKATIIGLYYGALTPSSTGGQPMQVVYMRRDGVPTGTATGIVSVKFVIYEITLSILAMVFFIFCGDLLSSGGLLWTTVLGFVINFVVLAAFVLFIFCPRFVIRIANALLRLLVRIKLIKNAEKAGAALNRTLSEFQSSVRSIMGNKLRTVGSVIIQAVNLVALFSIIYFVYRALGFDTASYPDMLSLQLFLTIAVSLIPTPGSAGASEGGFYLFFKGYFTDATMFTGMLIWRFLTYYLILLVGSVTVVADEFRMVKKKKQQLVLEASITEEPSENGKGA